MLMLDGRARLPRARFGATNTSHMERIGVVGLSWRRGGPELLARYTLPGEDRDRHVSELAQHIAAEELVYLATCNRIEITFVTRPDVPVEEVRRRVHAHFSAHFSAAAGEAQRTLQAWQGEGAVEHLFLVAMGLDSVRLGETEILGQVRSALEHSQSLGLVKQRLEPVFGEALRLAKRARNATHLGLGRTSLAEIGLDQVRARLARKPGLVALLGISAMTERCARALHDEGHPLLLVNRSLQRAADLAQQLGGDANAMALDDFRAQAPQINAVISASGAAGPLLDAHTMERLTSVDDSDERPLLVDFATDPDLDPQVAKRLGFDRLGMQEMLNIAERTRRGRLTRCGEAREMVDEALQRMAGKLGRRSADHAIGTLREAWLETAHRELEKLITKHFGDIDEVQAEALRKFATRLSKHFAHVPAAGLRNLAQTHGAGLVQEFFQGADAELATQIGKALEDGSLFANLGERSSE